MNELVEIAGRKVGKMEYRGRRVVTLRMVDNVHKKQHGTAKKHFQGHRDIFKAEADYFETPLEGYRVGSISSLRNGGIRCALILLTDRGYIKLAKLFTDDRSLRTCDLMVDRFFATTAAVKEGMAVEQPPAGSRLITDARYIELLEAQNALLKIKEVSHV